MVLPWDKDFLSSKTELSSKTILYASEGQNVNNVSRSIVKKILGNIDSKDYLNLPLEEIASQNFIFLYPKDKSVIEAYYGMQPSLALKYNFSHKSAATESAYFMMGMDFDSDMFAKIGVILNPGKKNKNLPTLPNPDGRVAVLFKAWRYVMLRQALEFGYRGHFLDTEEIQIEKYD